MSERPLPIAELGGFCQGNYVSLQRTKDATTITCPALEQSICRQIQETCIFLPQEEQPHKDIIERETPVGTLIYDPNRLLVVHSPLWEEPEEAFLTHRQGTYLEQLLAKQGTVVSRQELIGQTRDSLHSVNVEVHKIRRALHDIADKQGRFRIIETVFKRGYVIPKAQTP